MPPAKGTTKGRPLPLKRRFRTALRRLAKNTQEDAMTLVDLMPEVEDMDDALEIRAMLHDVLGLVLDTIAVADETLLRVVPNKRWWEGGDIVLPGGGVLKRSGGKEVEAYDNDLVASQYADRLTEHVMNDFRLVTADGEVLDPEEARTHIAELVHVMAAATGATAPSFSAWRSGVAKKFGVDIKAGARMRTTDVKLRIEAREKHRL